MKKKRKMGFAAAILAMVLLFAGCGQTETKTESSTAASETEDETLVHVLALKGPTSMGMVKMMSDNDSKESPADTFELAAAPDEVSAKLVQGEVDIAAVPANLASVLYNKTNGGVQVLAVNTLGVLYIVEDGDTVHSIADLKGRTIYAGGKGATPEYALNYILEKNGLVPGNDRVEERTRRVRGSTCRRCRWNRHAAAAVCNDGTDEKRNAAHRT